MKTPRPRKEPKPLVLNIPPKDDAIDRWIILGLDPSLSRTGYAFMEVTPDEHDGEMTKARWLEVGSVKPEETGDPIWVRSKAIALAIRQLLQSVSAKLRREHVDEFVAEDGQGPIPYWAGRTGLIISLEAPTPGNDYLSNLSRILHLVLLEAGGPVDAFAKVHIQLTNAATLRRLMGLTRTGRDNKVENVKLAYTFLDQSQHPNLDSDACDAVLMAMMARYTSAILLGFPDSFPERFKIALCDSTQELKGKGTHVHTRTKGLLYRPEYWSRYERKSYVVSLRNARAKKNSRMDKTEFTI